MNVVSISDYRALSKIDVAELKKNEVRKVAEGSIAPAKKEVVQEVVVDQSADPIKSIDDIIRISDYLIANERYRDNMLFIVGINFGLRASDLRMLRFCDLINDNLTFKDTFPVFEIKTRNTRKKRKNRYITINDAVMDSIILYLNNTPDVCLSDFMFVSNATNGKGDPLTVRSIARILTGIANDLDLNIHMSSHTLRKTFCYHQMLMSDNDGRKLLLLQKMLGHSTPAQTLDYIGITAEEIEAAYKELNLGSKDKCYIVNSKIVEFDELGA